MAEWERNKERNTQIRQLRSEGKGIGEIARILQCSKSMVSYHARHVELSDGQKQSLKDKTKVKNRQNGKCGCGRDLKTTKRCEDCNRKMLQYDRASRIRNKQAAINRYGGKCVFCGEDKLIFLTIDHINDNGTEHRRETGMWCGTGTYRWLKKNNYPEGFQTACFNCNSAKAMVGEKELRRILSDS